MAGSGRLTQLLIFVVSWDSFHFVFRISYFISSSDLFSHFSFQFFVFGLFVVVLFRRFFCPVFFFDFRQPVFTYGTTYTVQNQRWTRYARLSRRLEMRRLRFRPPCEKVRSSPHGVLCRWRFHFAASTHNPEDLVDRRHQRGVPSTRETRFGI